MTIWQNKTFGTIIVQKSLLLQYKYIYTILQPNRDYVK